jgi:hypothetical protein
MLHYLQITMCVFILTCSLFIAPSLATGDEEDLDVKDGYTASWGWMEWTAAVVGGIVLVGAIAAGGYLLAPVIVGACAGGSAASAAIVVPIGMTAVASGIYLTLPSDSHDITDEEINRIIL